MIQVLLVRTFGSFRSALVVSFYEERCISVVSPRTNGV